MEGNMLLLLLSVTVETSVIRQYHFIDQGITWNNAQAYCREHHDDLAYVNNQTDQKQLIASAGDNKRKGWIGLNRDPNNETAWRWSGGGLITYAEWGKKQPDNKHKNEDKGQQSKNKKWRDVKSTEAMPFYCVSLPPVEQSRKTWEEAVSHCRERRTDLVSLRSDTELLLTQALMKRVGTERVWIGLRYLGDHWLWVNGDPLGSRLGLRRQRKTIGVPR